jgi:hypothetical protein
MSSRAVWPWSCFHRPSAGAREKAVKPPKRWVSSRRTSANSSGPNARPSLSDSGRNISTRCSAASGRCQLGMPKLVWAKEDFDTRQGRVVAAWIVSEAFRRRSDPSA